MQIPCLFLLLVAAGWYGEASAAAIPLAAVDCGVGLPVLNHLGRPCRAVEPRCTGGPSLTVSSPRRCDSAAFNPNSACSLYHGGPVPSWKAWFKQHFFSKLPHSLHQSIFAVTQLGIPKLADTALRDSKDSDIPEAISKSENASWSTVQIVTPIVVGVCVAIFAVLIFVFYRRSRHLRSPDYARAHLSTPPLEHAAGQFHWYRRGIRSHQHLPSNGWLHAPWFIFRLFPSSRPTSTPKDPTWEIDREADVIWIHSPDESSTPSALSTYSRAHCPTPGDLDLAEPGDVAHKQPHSRIQSPHPHTREMSDASASSRTALLPRVDLPVTSFFDRFMRFKDGVRKSPSYKLVQVREQRPSSRFRIDRSNPTTRASTLEGPPAEPSPETTSSGSQSAGSSPPPRSGSPQPLEPGDDDERSVLLISRTPGVDFAMSDASCVSEHDNS
ncbi:hypothetical protein SCP_0301460 [Sparassis crispa]|uniref:Uncharacterized protein n=1 Tax=Sparassis crispa TaxID=139825 RepID=A0A401GE70_9APHY|nr:hypothetical protein SCP_0301460 [Sparassis crispa]GBE80431.1 hypothetical protein SCP_0301460 [Sparassis crispa]